MEAENQFFTNEAKRLLKTKGDVFPTALKAKRYMKIRSLFIESQEVIDKEGVMSPTARIDGSQHLRAFRGFNYYERSRNVY